MSAYATLQVHRRMLGDAGRLAAFEAGIAAAVRPGDVVVDLGTGTGVLAFLACRAGARRVHAIERTDIVEVAGKLAAANGCEDRVVFHHADSRDVELDERADVLLCDWLGPMGFDGGMFEELMDARDRLLAPGGRMVPELASVGLAPVESPASWETVGFWERPRAGLDVSAVADFAANAVESSPAEACQLLAEPVLVRELDPGTVRGLSFDAGVRFIVRRRGTLHGFSGFVAARMAQGVVLTNAPDESWAGASAGATARTETLSRPPRFFPLRGPIAVEEADTIELRFAAGRLAAGQVVWVWRGSLARGSRNLATFSHDSLNGTPLTANALEPA